MGMPLYKCSQCMKKFSDGREGRLACPFCNVEVRPYFGPPPLNLSRARLNVLRGIAIFPETPTPAARRNDALSRTLGAYEEQNVPAPAKGSVGETLASLRRDYTTPRDPSVADVSSVHVYPLVLTELSAKLASANIEFILYGSAALWLEGRARPQKDIQIKDLDMCVGCAEEGRVEMVQRIRELVAETLAVRAIDLADEERVYVTHGNTMEFTSRCESVQFSFNLQTPIEFAHTRTLSRSIPLVGDDGPRVSVTGLKFISHRLFGDGALLDTRLFRSDKTNSTLMYAAMAVGYAERPVEAVAAEILRYSVGRETAQLLRLLKAVGLDTYNKVQTQFFSVTQGIIARDAERRVAIKQRAQQRNAPIRSGAKRLQAAMTPQFASASDPVLRALRPILAERWQAFMAPDAHAVEDEEQREMQIAERQLREEALTFILTCLDDVDEQLRIAQWLPMPQTATIARGKRCLAEELERAFEQLYA